MEGGEGVFTDGSRMDGQTAAAMITKATLLGLYATVMEAEMLAIAAAREGGGKDSVGKGTQWSSRE